jgi:hypothetical protein
MIVADIHRGRESAAAGRATGGLSASHAVRIAMVAAPRPYVARTREVAGVTYLRPVQEPCALCDGEEGA